MQTLTKKHTVLFHDSYGDSVNPTCVLLPGLGAQGISWSDTFCSKLSELGLYVLRMDNRDNGRSKIFTQYSEPNLQLMKQGGNTAIHYNLEDMAKDVELTLSQLGIDRAHIMGRSMGGMIAQIFSSLYPQKSLSLCVIMSTTGNRSLTQPEPEIMDMLLEPNPDPDSNREDFLEKNLKWFKRLSGNPLLFDEKYYRDYILASLQRSNVPSGTLRQVAAMIASGDIRGYLKNITSPTLVIHGTKDPIFGVDAAKDIQHNVRNSHLCLIEGMGHEIPPELDEKIIEIIRAQLLTPR